MEVCSISRNSGESNKLSFILIRERHRIARVLIQGGAHIARSIESAIAFYLQCHHGHAKALQLPRNPSSSVPLSPSGSSLSFSYDV